MGNLYKCAAPTMGLLQDFFFEKRQMPDKCPGRGGGGGVGAVGID